MSTQKFELDFGRLPSLEKLTGHYSYFVLGLVLQFRPKHVLEIGLGCDAETATLILQALEINAKSGCPKGKYSVIELVPKTRALERLQLFNTKPENFNLITGDSEDIKNYAGFNAEVDLVLIDGRHSYQFITNEFNCMILQNTVDPVNCVFVFHDIQFAEVRVAMKDLAEKYDLQLFYFPKDNIGIARYKF